MATRGYLAFPPSSSAIPGYPDSTLELSSIRLPSVSNSGSDVLTTLELIQTHHDRGSHHNQSDAERLGVYQSEQSEVEWVRAGGVLRDASGQRDKMRTERMLAEINLREDEQRKVERWERYESKWRGVCNKSGEPLTFFDFSWPLCNLPAEKRIDGLTTLAIGEFLFESADVCGCSAARRERIRYSLLRWHPDRISPVLRRVVAEDVELVREGVLRVFCALRVLQDTERTTSMIGTP